MKIIILTQPLHNNYGGLLQAYALQHTLKELGHEVVTARDGANRKRSRVQLPYFLFHLYKRYITGDMRFNPYKFMFPSLGRSIIERELYVGENCKRFIDTHINTIDIFGKGHQPSLESIAHYDAIVVGSDQVWRADYSYVPTYFLSFTKGLNIKRIAYAASFGKDNLEGYTRPILEECRSGAELFDAISVREQSGVYLCRETLGVEATEMVDPTLLLEPTDYLGVIEEADITSLGNNILMNYTLDKSQKNYEIAEFVATKMGLTPHCVMPSKTLHQEWSNIEECRFPSVSAWLAGFRDAKFVVTDSFHGTVFAIIFNKPFVVINNTERGSTRFDSLLRNFNLESRMVSSIDEVSDKLLNEPIDFTAVNHRRAKLKAAATEWLTSSLKR